MESANVKIDEYSEPREKNSHDESKIHQDHDVNNHLEFNEMIVVDEEEQVNRPSEQGIVPEPGRDQNIRLIEEDEQEIVHDLAGNVAHVMIPFWLAWKVGTNNLTSPPYSIKTCKK